MIEPGLDFVIKFIQLQYENIWLPLWDEIACFLTLFSSWLGKHRQKLEFTKLECNHIVEQRKTHSTTPSTQRFFSLSSQAFVVSQWNDYDHIEGLHSFLSLFRWCSFTSAYGAWPRDVSSISMFIVVCSRASINVFFLWKLDFLCNVYLIWCVWFLNCEWKDINISNKLATRNAKNEGKVPASAKCKVRFWCVAITSDRSRLPGASWMFLNSSLYVSFISIIGRDSSCAYVWVWNELSD